VGIATGYGLDDRGVGVRIPVGSKILISYRPDRLRSGRYERTPRGTKRQGSEADHSSAISAEVKKTWIYTSTPHTPAWRSA
jgi:hypothetical protein